MTGNDLVPLEEEVSMEEESFILLNNIAKPYSKK